jgi:hypothetical protein
MIINAKDVYGLCVRTAAAKKKLCSPRTALNYSNIDAAMHAGLKAKRSTSQ